MNRAPLGTWDAVGQLEAAVSRSVAGVDLTPRVQPHPDAGAVIDHRQGLASAALVETEDAAPGAPARHLAYSVAVLSAPVLPAGDEAELPIAAELVVTVWYRLRSGSVRDDRRAATYLAHDVLRACYEGAAGYSLQPTNAWAIRERAGEWLIFDLRFLLGADLTFGS